MVGLAANGCQPVARVRSGVLPLLAVLALSSPLLAVTGPEAPRRLRVIYAKSTPAALLGAEGGDAPGLYREILEGYGGLNRVSLEFATGENSQQLVADLLRGRGDVVAGLADRPEWRSTIGYTSEVLSFRVMAITARSGRKITTLAGLRAERVGVVSGSSTVLVAQESAIPSIVPFQTEAEMIAALKRGAVGAAISTVGTVALARDPDVIPGPLLGRPGSVAFAVRKQDEALRVALDEYLQSLRKSGRWSRLVVKYLGEGAADLFRRAQEAGPAE